MWKLATSKYFKSVIKIFSDIEDIVQQSSMTMVKHMETKLQSISKITGLQF